MTQEEMIAKFYHKVSALREDLLAQDWKDDKAIRMSGNQIPFLSSDKIKKTVAPLFSKHGIELRTQFDELTFMDKATPHCTIRLTATMIDVETGYSDSSCAYGEASDMNDKSVSKAQTYAIKYWLMSQFLIADGIDPDTLNAFANGGGNFYKKSAEEQEEVTSKVLEQGIKPVKKAEAVKEEVKEEKTKPEVKETKEESKKEEIKEAPAEKKPAKKEAPKVAEKKSDQSSPVFDNEPNNNSFTPTGPQAKAIQRIMDKWEEKAKAGEVTPEEYNKMSMAKATMSTPKEAIAFIKTYKVG